MKRRKAELVRGLGSSRRSLDVLQGAVLTTLALTLVFSSTGCLHRHPRTRPVSRRAPPPTYPPTRTQPGAEPRVQPRPAPIVQGEEGIASWYGHPYHGRQTASGEIYNMYDMTAAHRTLPFGSQVKVHNLQNGSQAVVRINDRGPFVEGRIIDLSYVAAQAIHMPGTAFVRLEILGLKPLAEPGVYAVQVGAFRDRSNAERLKQLIATRSGPVAIQGFDRGDGYFYRVRVGHESSEEAARQLARKLRDANLATETFVVRLN